ncbi:hypothetical protein PACILC2_22950 [Paenibacillus cisolokensis]|uniref:Prophage tail endopeptidase domain-containing protein n=1 Tax=Paenibacillus cisolokensis TaxID=1658519 RepID=A0ABQ4N6D4_9BACL|nr:prophage endopeptidase tail family protein [Paenibacillus cisolokensis]GIQ63727.1 hypothetical protein PACILC2_22950 [Paenibacillus cisolokensis]
MANKFASRLEIWTGGQRLGILRDAKEVRVNETLNGQYYVTFAYPRLPDDHERYAALYEDNEVRFPVDMSDRVAGQIFVIKRVEEIRRGRSVYKVVEAHHVAFQLAHYFLDEYVDFAAAKTPEFLLAKLGNNTPFTFYVEGSFAPKDVFEWGEARKIDLLNAAVELYNAELSYDNYAITFTTRAGGNYGAEVRYGKNLPGLQRTSHSMERVTRLYGYGKNGLTIEGYAGHTKNISIRNISTRRTHTKAERIFPKRVRRLNCSPKCSVISRPSSYRNCRTKSISYNSKRSTRRSRRRVYGALAIR